MSSSIADSEEISDESSSDEEENPVYEQGNNYIKNNSSETQRMTAEQLLDSISSMVDRLILIDDENYNGCGSNVTYEKSGDIKVITVSNIIFEINQILISEIIITRNPFSSTSVMPCTFTINIHYILQCIGYVNDQIFNLAVPKSTCKESLKAAYDRFKKMRRCGTCKIAVYDTEVTDHCVACLFSDYFTIENPLITCSICHEKTKDFLTLECGHRYCIRCIYKVEPRKCPLCRAAFILPR